MRPWVDRVTFSSGALEHIASIISNFLIVAAGILLLIIGAFLSAA